MLLEEKVGLSSSSSGDTGKGKSKMSKHVTHGYHLVKGKSYHDMEDYVFTQFNSVDDNELGLFAIFDGHLSHEVPDYLRSHLFENLLNEPVLANVGDSRAVICKNGVAKQLSIDHKPSKEHKSIEDRGGSVSTFLASDGVWKEHLSLKEHLTLMKCCDNSQFMVMKCWF